MQKARPAPVHFVPGDRLAVANPHPDWDIILGHGPVIATAIHDGHAMRPSLHPHLALEAHERRREEDPLTGVLTAVGDVRIRVDASRFQVDLNRPWDKAVSRDPADTWGLKVWHAPLPDAELEASLAAHDRFYAMVGELIESMLQRWDALLLVDIHSYNHRRDGVDAAPAPQAGNPDIELGVTTLDADRWGHVARRFAPEEVRPVTCITLDADEIKAFINAHDGYGVIKPLQGSGGQSVFVVTPESAGNLNQMIDAVTRDGYAIVQEYLPKAVDGDLRLLTLNGRPLQVDGHYACFRRYNDSGDARSNITAGGKIEMAVPDADALRLAEIVGPKLMRDGMYLAGLDIVGDKMMEVNVDTPGGINMAEELTGADFSGHIIEDLERKVRLRDQYKRTLTNTELAMM